MSGNLSQGFPWKFFLCLIQASGGSERKRCETQNLNEEWLMRWVNISSPRCAEGSVCMMVGSSSARVNRETQRIEKCNIALLHPTGDPRLARISFFLFQLWYRWANPKLSCLFGLMVNGRNGVDCRWLNITCGFTTPTFFVAEKISERFHTSVRFLLG